jgi:hypothetical protein
MMPPFCIFITADLSFCADALGYFHPRRAYVKEFLLETSRSCAKRLQKKAETHGLKV